MTKTGVNTDPRNPVGDPPADKLRGFTYARFPYNVSVGIGSLDFEAAYQFYAPRIEALRQQGVAPVIVFTHQTWGEDRGFNWKQMSDDDWNRFITGFIAAIRRVVVRFVGNGFIYQIHNETDNDHKDNVASVYVPPVFYGRMFREAHGAIKGLDPSARVIIGGLVTGPGKGIPYFEDAQITETDGIGIHCYGAGAGGLYGPHGTIEYQLSEWRKLNTPLWITEFGVLDQPNEPVARVAEYARAFIKACGDLPAIWYGYAHGMHNGYGIEKDGVMRQELFEALTAQQPTPVYNPYVPGFYTLSGNGVRVRERAGTGAPIIATLNSGARVHVTGSAVAVADGYGWQIIELDGGKLGAMALHGPAVTWSLEPVPVTPAPDPRDETLARNREAFVAIRDRAAAEIAAIDAVLGA